MISGSQRGCSGLMGRWRGIWAPLRIASNEQYSAGTRYSLFASRSSADAPERAVAVLGEDERAVLRLCDPDRPAPDRRVVDRKAGDEILVFAGRHAVFHDRPDDL